MDLRGDIFDIKRFAIHDGPGIRTTVFFRGCPLECWWCHNPEARFELGTAVYKKRGRGFSLPGEQDAVGPSVPVDAVMLEIEKDMIFYQQSRGGLTVSGGEPLMQHGFIEELLRRCREKGIHTAVDTSGYAPWEIIERIHPLTDLFMYDLKLAVEKAHEEYTNVSNTLIRENFMRLAPIAKEMIIRLPMIPGITDTEENLEGLLELIESADNIEHISLLPYNRLGEDKFERFRLQYKPGRLSTYSHGELEEIAGLFESRGFHVRIGG
jgi:pyruvate formate lyase activating enzyme